MGGGPVSAGCTWMATRGGTELLHPSDVQKVEWGTTPSTGLEAMVNRFEEAVCDQRPVAADHYDDEYFTADWRQENNRYELETRRRIEDRNPQLIADVFRPQRVLDVGCGPGFLMYFLHELGIRADGIDFSPRSRGLAP